MKKVVFNINKYILDCLHHNISHNTLSISMNWAKNIDGLSKDELEDMGFVIDNNWCVEILYDA